MDSNLEQNFSTGPEKDFFLLSPPVVSTHFNRDAAYFELLSTKSVLITLVSPQVAQLSPFYGKLLIEREEKNPGGIELTISRILLWRLVLLRCATTAAQHLSNLHCS